MFQYEDNWCERLPTFDQIVISLGRKSKQRVMLLIELEMIYLCNLALKDVLSHKVSFALHKSWVQSKRHWPFWFTATQSWHHCVREQTSLPSVSLKLPKWRVTWGNICFVSFPFSKLERMLQSLRVNNFLEAKFSWMQIDAKHWQKVRRGVQTAAKETTDAQSSGFALPGISRKVIWTELDFFWLKNILMFF